MDNEEERRKALHPLPPTTTKQEDITKESQRRINLIWEYTQSAIALMTVTTCMFVFIQQSRSGVPKEFPATLSNMVFAVLAFYLARTNHQAIGGTGRKPNDEQAYLGR